MSGGGGQDHSPVRDLLSLWARKEAKEFGEPRRNFLVNVVICMEEESFPSSKHPSQSQGPSMYHDKERVTGSSRPSVEVASHLPLSS